MSSRPVLSLTVSATNCCNRGCRHCSTEAKADGEAHFTRQMARQLLRSIEASQYDAYVTITGGGEPLLSPEIVQVTDIFVRSPRVRKLSFITSGFLKDESVEKQRFEAIVRLPFSRKKVFFVFSFNNYNPTFSERLLNALKYAAESLLIRRIGIKMCVSQENFEKTYDDFYDILHDLWLKHEVEISEYMVDFSEVMYKHVLPIFNWRYYTEKLRDWLRCEAHQLSCVFICHSRQFGHTIIKLEPFSFWKNGRGKDIEEKPLYLSWKCPILFKGIYDENGAVELDISESGLFYPGCGCYSATETCLGHLSDPLGRMIGRKKALATSVLKSIIMNPERVESRQGHCQMCRRIMGNNPLWKLKKDMGGRAS